MFWRSLPNQPRSQRLSSLPPLVVGTETLVAAGHVTIYPPKTAGWVGTQVHLVESKFVTVAIKNPVAPPFQQSFLPPRFWVVRWPAATRFSVPTTKRGRKERPWERGCVKFSYLRFWRQCKLAAVNLSLFAFTWKPFVPSGRKCSSPILYNLINME